MRPGYAVLVVPAVAGALLLVWWTPWSSGTDVIARAGAAFGTQQVVHVTASDASASRFPTGSDSVEIWFQPAQRRFHVVSRHARRVVGDIAFAMPAGTNVAAFGPPAPLAYFVTSYRLDLVRRTLRAGGSERIQGRRIRWLRARRFEVAIDPVSYQPIWIRAPGTTQLTSLAVAQTIPLDPADFLTLRERQARHL